MEMRVRIAANTRKLLEGAIAYARLRTWAPDDAGNPEPGRWTVRWWSPRPMVMACGTAPELVRHVVRVLGLPDVDVLPGRAVDVPEGQR
jgi:hypothetical protein